MIISSEKHHNHPVLSILATRLSSVRGFAPLCALACFLLRCAVVVTPHAPFSQVRWCRRLEVPILHPLYKAGDCRGPPC